MTDDRNTAVETAYKLLWSATEIASALGLSRSKIFSMMSSGQLPPSIKLGNSRRWSRVIIEKWIDLQCPSLERFLTLTGDERR